MPMTLSSYPSSHINRLKLCCDVRPLSIWYRMAQRFLQVMMCSFWRVRVFNRRFEPPEGGVLYICNHQSYLDPPLAAFALQRPMHFMARDSLFRFGPFRWLIESLNAFPVRRGVADTKAMKEAIRRLKNDKPVVIFPEGTRTEDGRVRPFLPGVALLAQRAAAWTVPTLIDGAYECWPKGQGLPDIGNVVVQYAAPISRDQAGKMSPEEFVGDVRKQIVKMQTEVRRRVGRPELTYDD